MTDIARFIDHTLLRPDATEKDVIKLCDEAGTYNFHAVCIHPSFVSTAREVLYQSHTKIAAVIGFPLGMTLTRVKIYEAMEAVTKGAGELDIVINISNAISDNWSSVQDEIADIITATPDVLHKIIIETCYLSEGRKKKACTAVMNAGAEFIKTSTGFGPSGAQARDVELIHSVTEGKIGIKAAGGIKTLADTRAFIHAGATRIGTSSGIDIVGEEQKRKSEKEQ